MPLWGQDYVHREATMSSEDWTSVKMAVLIVGAALVSIHINHLVIMSTFWKQGPVLNTEAAAVEKQSGEGNLR